MSHPTAQAATAAAIAAAVRTFNTELWTFYAVGVLVTTFRAYALVKAGAFETSEPTTLSCGLPLCVSRDLFMSCTSTPIANAGRTPQLLYTTQFTLAYFAVNHGQGLANNAMTDAQRAALSPDSTEYQLRYVRL
jgi:hypothetical protein